MFRPLGRTIVFASTETFEYVNVPRMLRHGPAVRGDLDCLRDESPGTALLLEGHFGSRLSVSPAECRRLIFAGWSVLGAGSIGALRASELWNIGMIGVGEVFTMYRIGRLHSDADVGVIYDAASGSTLTASIVHVRSILSELEHNALISPTAGRHFLKLANGINWTERYWTNLLYDWKTGGMSAKVLRSVRARVEMPESDPKRRDAAMAFEILRSGRWLTPRLSR
jgi:hypothetical protein